MKRKIMLLAVALMMFMGVVSASSINGDYKGNPIVKVLSNGVALQTDEVPAMIYDGHTVVPISLLRQIGASVEWNADTYSVDVKMPTVDSHKVSDLGMITENYRAVYKLADLITLTIITNSVLDDHVALNQSSEFIRRINGISYSSLDNWYIHLSDTNQPDGVVNNYRSAMESLKKAVSHMKNLDSNGASKEILKAADYKNEVFKQIESNYDFYLMYYKK